MRKTAFTVVVTFVAAYLVGRWWFDEEPKGPVPPPAIAGSQRRAENEGAPFAGPAGASPDLRLSRLQRLPVLPARSDDDVLEAMMIEHRDAMLLLREAIYHEVVYRSPALAACSASMTGKDVCWMRFQCKLRAQLMEVRFASVDCGSRTDSVLQACVHQALGMRDPIGVPVEASRDLGDYVGPVAVSWYPE